MPERASPVDDHMHLNQAAFWQTALCYGARSGAYLQKAWAQSDATAPVCFQKVVPTTGA